MENNVVSKNFNFATKFKKEKDTIKKNDHIEQTFNTSSLINSIKDDGKTSQALQNFTISTFTVNKAAIPALENSVLEPALCHLPGVTSFAQSTYEQGVINQLEKAIDQNKLFDSDDDDNGIENQLVINFEDYDEDKTFAKDENRFMIENEFNDCEQTTNNKIDNNNDSEYSVMSPKLFKHIALNSETKNNSDDEYNNDDTKNDPTYQVDVSESESDLDNFDGPDYQQVNENFYDDDVDRIEQAPETDELLNWSKKRKRKWSSSVLRLEKSQHGSETYSQTKRATATKSPTSEDDGDVRKYRRRLAKYRFQLAEANTTEAEYNELTSVSETDEQLQIPKRIWERLFAHQQECLRWLWSHHSKGVNGAIIGDEMGLGKTIQVIAFLIALRHSRCSPTSFTSVHYRSLGPVLLVCPATVMAQWVGELHRWWPPFRVAVLHSTSTYEGADKRKLIREIFAAGVPSSSNSRSAENDCNKGSILITSYSSVSLYIDQLASYNWHYVILDEGHKIRNPEAQVTIHCKQFKTSNRLILSGSPIQNNLRELWSLFDFIYPLKLGTLRDFTTDIAEPIRRGGYLGATDLQIKVAYKCTVKLRAVIQPYLLRRTKEEVKLALNLPAKTEQVLFCKLTDKQRELYLKYLGTSIVQKISRGDERVFAALINIRKICNHPFLFNRRASEEETFPLSTLTEEDPFDQRFFAQSGKMAVVHALLKLWSKQGHKVLFFTQSRQMLDIVERYIQLRQYSYLRMDGTTAMGARQRLISQFNTDQAVFIFLLTTKVGGLGVNLTGANRVLIYDPDWNPCTDMQARERCWRIGQRNDVIIYRLLTAGTVEEKIYHRQIYKQYLTNSVLKDPNHQRFFKINDLKELFTLSDFNETTEFFSDAKTKFSKEKEKIKGLYSKQKNLDQMIVRKDCGKLPKIRKVVESNKTNSPNIASDIEKEKTNVEKTPVCLEISEQKRGELREKARLLSKKLLEKFNKNKNSINEQTNSNQVANECSTSKTTKIKKGVKCEGKRIEEIVAKEDYYSDSNDSDQERKEKRKKSKKDKKKEDYLLRGLLGDALESVLQHEKIENVTTPDHYYLEAEAEKIASKAIEKMQQDSSLNLRESSLENSLETPSHVDSRSLNTSTTIFASRQINNNALAKIIANKNGSNTSSSSNLIALVKANVSRQNFCVVGNSSTTNSNLNSTLPSMANSSNKLQTQLSFKSFTFPSKLSSQKSNFLDCSSEKLLEKLRDFLRYHSKETPNSATTAEILSHFADRILPQHSAIFKAMLKQICFRRQTEGGIVVWHLKAAFRNSANS